MEGKQWALVGLLDRPDVGRESFYLKVLHAHRVDDGTEKKFEDDERVDGDADANARLPTDVVAFEDAIIAVDNEPDDDGHPAEDARAHNEQRRYDGLIANQSG